MGFLRFDKTPLRLKKVAQSAGFLFLILGSFYFLFNTNLVFAKDINMGTAGDRILLNGNIGIGTADPGTKLQIVGSDTFLSSYLNGNSYAIRKVNFPAGGGWARNLFQFEEYDGSIITSMGVLGSNNTMSYGYIGNTYNDAALQWYQNKNVAFNGNVGINQTNPTVKLQITGGGIDANGTVNGTGLCIAGDCKVSWGAIVSAGGGSLWSGAMDGNIWNGTSGGGNVGIGTTNPGAKLAIDLGTQTTIKAGLSVYRNGDENTGIKLLTGATDGASLSGWNGGLGSWYGIGFHSTYDNITRGVFNVRTGDFTTTGLLSMQGAGNNYFAGNVGIGTAAPLAQLHVYNNTSSSYSLQELLQAYPAGTGTSQAALRLSLISGSGLYGYGGEIAGYLTQGVGGGLTFSTVQNTTPVERMRIDSIGNVGINQTNPTVKLQITGGGIDANGTVNGTGLCIAGDCKVSWPSIVAAGGGNLWGGAMDGNIWNGTSGGGNVGIGTTAPAAKLDVNGSIALNGNTLYLHSGTNTFHQIKYGTIGGVVDAVGVIFNGAFVAAVGPAGSETAKMTILNNGNVGIGTTAPGNLLELGTTNPVLSFHRGDNQSLGSNVVIGRIQSQSNYGTSDASISASDIRFLTADVWYRGQIAFYTNDSNSTLNLAEERMRIDMNGNVGINQTNPTVKLQITGGGIDANGTVNGTGLCIAGDCKVSWPSIVAAGGGNLWGGAMDGNIWNGTSGGGNVGIGTTNPGASLEVYGASQITSALADAGVRTGILALNSSLSNYGSGGTLTFGNNQAKTAGSLGMAAIKGFLTDGGGNTVGDLVFSTRNATTDTALTERMRILANGNVGIGTTNPGAKLNIATTGNTPEILRLYSDQQYADGGNWGLFGGYQSFYGKADPSDITAKETGRIGFKIMTHSVENGPLTSDLYLGGVNAGTFTEGLRITSAGKVGIGIVSPEGKLHVVGITPGMPAVSGTTQTGLISRFQGLSTNGVLDIGNGDSGVSWLQSTDRSDLSQGYKLLLNPNGGNVGIGTTNPTVKLQITGGGIDANGTVNGTGLCIANDCKVSWPSIVAAGGGNLWGGAMDGNIWNGTSGGGNVGIGTTAPAEKLHVQAARSSDAKSAIVAGEESNNAILYFGTPYLGDPNNGLKAAIIAVGQTSYSRSKLYFSLDNTALNSRTYDASVSNVKMTIQADGNVGIGTTGPVGNLHISSTGDSTSVLIQSYVADLTDATANLFFKTLGNSDNTFKKNAIISHRPASYGWGKSDLAFAVDIANDTDNAVLSDAKLFISGENGNVGIGTTAPYSTLNVSGNGTNINGKGLIIGTVGDAINTVIPLNSEVGRFEIGFPGWRDMEQNQIGAKIAGIRMNYFSNNNALVQASELGFFTGSGGTGNNASFHDTSVERMRINSSGYVGINQTNPTVKLQITGGGIDANGTVNGTGLCIAGDCKVSWPSIVAAGGGNLWGGAMDGNIWNGTSGGGNVGIGTVSPGTPLHIYKNGTGALTQLTLENHNSGNGDGNAILFQNYYKSALISATGNAGSVTGGSLQLQTYSSDSTLNTGMLIDRLGNVGIGTTNPTSNLEVSKLNADISFDVNTNSRPKIISKGWSADLDIHTFQVGGTENNGQLYLQSSGNVGIGTTVPGKKLTVSVADSSGMTSANTSVIRLVNPDTTLGAFTGIQFNHLNDVNGQTTAMIGAVLTDKTNSWTSDLVFGTKSGIAASDVTEYMRIKMGGNVGIGTTNPGNYKLNVAGGIYATSISGLPRKTFSFGFTNSVDYYLIATLPISNSSTGDGVVVETTGLTSSTQGKGKLTVALGQRDGFWYVKRYEGNPRVHVVVYRTVDGSSNVYVYTPSPSYTSGEVLYYQYGWGSTVGYGATLYDNPTVSGVPSGTLIFDSNNDTTYPINDTLSTGAANFSGNVGIGTTNPTVKLQITGGGIDANGTVNGTGLCIANDCKVSWPSIVAAGGGNLWGGAMDGNIWNGTSGGGNVGIGTTNPVAKLNVIGDLRVKGSRELFYNGSGALTIQSNDGGGWVNQYGFLGSAGTNVGSFGAFGGTDSLTYLYAGASYSSPTMVWTGGNVGIGTTDPNGTLHTFRSTDGDNLRLENGWSNTLTRFNTNGTSGSQNIQVTNAAESAYLPLALQPLGGNVGIGTTDPGSKLELYTNSAGSVVNLLKLRNNGTTAAGVGILFTNYVYPSALITSSGDATWSQYGNLRLQTYNGSGVLNTGMLMDENGNVGIGTTNPTVKLQITGGGIDANGTVNGTGLCIANDCKVSWPSIVAAGGGNLWGGAMDGNIWNGTSGGGNVGIGTTNPGGKLDVRQASSPVFNFGQTDYTNSPGVNTTISTIRFQNQMEYGDKYADLKSVVRVGQHMPSFVFSTGPTYGTQYDRMMITENGNVGIGTTNPLAKLEIWHVNASSDPNTSNYPLKLYNNTWSGNEITGIEFWNGNSKVVPTSRIISQMNGSGNDGENLFFQTQPSSATNPNPNQPTTKLFISADGNVGIGTTAPGTLLEIKKAESNAILTINRHNATYTATQTEQSGINFNYSTSVYGELVGAKIMAISESENWNPVTGLSFSTATTFNSSATEKVRITGTGNVGIGTTNPSSLLFIQSNNAGDARLTLNNTAAEGKRWDFQTGKLGVSDPDFYIRNQTDNLDVIVLKSNGNVGIGTTAPAGTLQVMSQKSTYVGDTAQLILSGTNNSQRLIVGYNTTADKSYLQSTNMTGYTDLLLNPNDGNVGIGTTNPTVKLQITGGGIDANGTVNGTGLCIAGDCKTGWEKVFSSSGIIYNRRSITIASDSATANDYIIAYNGPNGGTITLPVALCNSGTVGVGRAYEITNESATATVTVTTDNTTISKISGNTQQSLAPYNSIPVYCNGTSWFIY